MLGGRGRGLTSGATDDFDVSVFLTEAGARHSLLSKRRHLREAAPPAMRSNSDRLLGETRDQPVDVDADEPALGAEDSDDDGIRLADIPLAAAPASKRPPAAIDVGSDTDEPAAKRPRGDAAGDAADAADDGDGDKKKLAMDVSYQGFAIHGRVLCLVVRRRDGGGGRARRPATGGAAGQGQAKMENWITSTQVAVGEESQEP